MQTSIANKYREMHFYRDAEEILRRCVHCGFCNATCPTFQLLGDELDGPRGRIYLVKQMLEGEPASDITRHRGMIWSDALGLSAFGVVGCHVALAFGSPPIIAVFMGMVTATGGGVIRDVLTNTQPLILCGQPYATAALLGSLSYACLRYLAVPEIAAEAVACAAAFSLRASAIIFNIRMGPPGEFIRIGRAEDAAPNDS